MPNQRAKNKIYLGGFVDKKLHARLVRAAAQAGRGDNKFGFVSELVEAALKRRGRLRTAARKAPRRRA